MSALKDSIQASFDGDAETVCALQTKEYSAAVSAAMAEQGFVDEDATCEDAMLVLSGMIAGFGGADYGLDQISFLAESGDGKTVTLRATYTGGQSNGETYQVSYVDGEWLVSGDAETRGTMSASAAHAICGKIVHSGLVSDGHLTKRRATRSSQEREPRRLWQG